MMQANTSNSTVSEESLRKTWKQHAGCHIHGQYCQKQAVGEELPWCNKVLSDEHPCTLPMAVTCAKGSKSTPNQDNFSVTRLRAGCTIMCCMDGHGPDGHRVSHRTVQTVPFFLVNSSSFPHDMETALNEAFDSAHKDLIELASLEDWDLHGSGSTAVTAVWNGSTVWIANTGDSRCVIGTEVGGHTLFQTVDHKPNQREEKRRINERGGHVVQFAYPDGSNVHRVFLRGQNFPGLSMSRSFGDLAVKEQGVIATPDISVHKVDPNEKPFLVLGSDGVWEFLETDFVVDIVAQTLQQAGAVHSVERLRAEARKAWHENQGDNLDDITALVVRLGTDSECLLDDSFNRQFSSSSATRQSACASQCLAIRLLLSQFSERVASFFAWDADAVSELDSLSSTTDEEDLLPKGW